MLPTFKFAGLGGRSYSAGIERSIAGVETCSAFGLHDLVSCGNRLH